MRALPMEHEAPSKRLPLGVRVFDSPDCPADPEVLAVLRDGLLDADLAAPPVVLPDFYRKPVMEMPSSVAVATRETIRPTLTSAALNCGMALAAVHTERPSDDSVRAFYRDFLTAYPYPPDLRPRLSREEVVRCASEGARIAVDRFDLDPAELKRIEENGCLDVEKYGGRRRVRSELGEMAIELARLRFGTVGPSTHFVELQEVEEVFEPETAARWGVRAGGMTLQFHGGDGVLNIQLGARFGRRRAGSRSLRAVMAVQKPLYQMTSARSVRQLRQRLRLYFSDGCPPIERGSEEGERLMLANAMAMNYGFAYRQATYAALRRLAAQNFGAGMHLVVDSPHNTIYEEEVGGRTAIVHRHNSARALPPSRLVGHPAWAQTGQPLLLPGTNRTCSYLCVAGMASEDSLHTANHGTGSIISAFVRRGISGPDAEGHKTMRFGYRERSEHAVSHLDNQGVDEGLRILTAAGIVRPVARLRPFAVLT